MLKIGICDKSIDFSNYLMEMLKEIMFEYADWTVRVYADSDEVIAFIEQKEFDCNLLFMDIFQKNISGMAVAKAIEQHHMDTDIIFVTESEDYVFECYKHRAFAYLLKPLQEKDIREEIKRYMTEIQSNPKCLNIKIRGQNIRIPLERITHIESKHRMVIVHTPDKDYEYYEKLDVLEELLCRDGFVRCHQSYLVATDKITACAGRMIYLDKYALPISRRYQKVIMEMVAECEIAVTTEALDAGVLTDESAPTEQEGLDDIPEDNTFITSGIFQNYDTKGALVCIQGAYVGNIVRLVPEQTIVIGRDGTSADMVVNFPMVSRRHCTIIYHQKDNNYELTDYSANGTFADGDTRLVKGNTYLLNPGTTLCFGDRNTIYKLG